jgi:hypothetical protein
MRRVSLIAALTVPLLGAAAGAATGAQAQARDTAEFRIMGARRCPKADSLFGRLWRSHASIIRVRYSPARDTTIIRTPHRSLSWQPGSSHLVVSESVIQIPGELRPADSARIELHLGFVDSIYRTPEQARLILQIDDSVQVDVQDPQVDFVMGVKTSGIPLVVTALLTPAQSLALARGHEVKGIMGPFPFSLYSWELWEINAIYRGSSCGIE